MWFACRFVENPGVIESNFKPIPTMHACGQLVTGYFGNQFNQIKMECWVCKEMCSFLQLWGIRKVNSGASSQVSYSNLEYGLSFVKPETEWMKFKLWNTSFKWTLKDTSFYFTSGKSYHISVAFHHVSSSSLLSCNEIIFSLNTILSRKDSIVSTFIKTNQIYGINFPTTNHTSPLGETFSNELVSPFAHHSS